VNRGDPAIPLEPDATTRTRLAADGHAALSKRSEVAQECAPADAEFGGQICDGRCLPTA
jgi:hypothetical protein